ncbi:MAG: hypothetical protein A2750_04120 [Candidatus Yanofskybacteria bacterium RIFCSPHIGHO2_01_FULL_45_42]|uniref:Uncharacterized protein n=3 Tax=Candidatus Yanofskyibacteriota TaxID=1752733 RepID=A0A1F8EZ09_9BACT|nr:MAG: hypothetical protein A2750_04120 [Candidatus Yanofskybacteria bacterium RIFCSPHIGHO2_01_FULL_45_42]OGN15410.1 MAG: hypothetical protein A3C81_01595 [Candidatus Yanofskybacteria bacterium RIFCSPHIGHO2_02_FULL_46_19]OGN28249.1 MAG: hypothetical protein A3B17_02060 [Candidatus Yanofskybacteria bacterium RIFCSPLOWO2_01_FULL_45_72]OGN32452.1 MAG: hypothetical protein A3J01_00075 [Candidatus Yanofskybacteria bacterium RIFCSPLOWO2_02_FULL_45_18]
MTRDLFKGYVALRIVFVALFCLGVIGLYFALSTDLAYATLEVIVMSLLTILVISAYQFDIKKARALKLIVDECLFSHTVVGKRKEKARAL